MLPQVRSSPILKYQYNIVVCCVVVVVVVVVVSSLWLWFPDGSTGEFGLSCGSGRHPHH